MRGVALWSILVSGLVSGCTLYSEADDDVPWPDDAPLVDAPRIDAPIDAVDAPIDCCIEPMPTLHGQLELFEIEVLDPEGDGSLGQGPLGRVHFSFPELDGQPQLESNPGTPFGCKAWVYTPVQAAAAGGRDEGTVQLSLPGTDPPVTATCTFSAGVGYQCPGASAVVAGLADPGLMPDPQPFVASLTSGGGNDVPSFTASGSDVGDDFVLPPAELAELEAIPRDGAAFTIACDAAVCTNATAIATLLEIVTTDAATMGLPPVAMPPPVTRQVVLRCAELGVPSLTVPAAFSNLIATSGATRIQTTFRRGKLAAPMPSVANVVAFGGHGIRGFSD